MRIAVDLHIHSALSPCSDSDMTPNNIVNMAVIKGLDAIAVTDHNSAENLGAILKCGADKGIMVIPGMELETREEVHLVCLFPDLAAALEMQERVYAALPLRENREDIFGEQIILNEDDEVVGKNSMFLITAADMGLEEAIELVRSLGGVVIPAHIDRDSYSLISNLGLIPESLGLRTLEVSKGCDADVYYRRHPELAGYDLVRSSDAHHLWDIFERESFIEVGEFSVNGILKALGG